MSRALESKVNIISLSPSLQTPFKVETKTDVITLSPLTPHKVKAENPPTVIDLVSPASCPTLSKFSAVDIKPLHRVFPVPHHSVEALSFSSIDKAKQAIFNEEESFRHKWATGQTKKSDSSGVLSESEDPVIVETSAKPTWFLSSVHKAASGDNNEADDEDLD
ncbi:hypothetical protein C8J56DRAFT_1044529 [Mycena floridula]|nr:hypothetical protein C8J56DRAFT_1044529 [Mycena floridula]